MSDDLVRRLHLPWPKDENVDEVTMPAWVLALTAEAADRIKELEAKLASLVPALSYEGLRTDEAEAKLATASYNATAFGHRIVALEAKLERISEEWASALYGDLDHGVKSLSEAAHLDFHRRFPSVASFGSTLLDIMLEDNT